MISSLITLIILFLFIVLGLYLQDKKYLTFQQVWPFLQNVYSWSVNQIKKTITYIKSHNKK